MENAVQAKKAKGHNLLYGLIGIVILAGVGGWLWYDAVENQYFKTDNAKVTARIYSVTAPMPGKLVKLSVEKGDKVKENEIIGRVESGTYVKSPIDGEVIKCDVTINQTVAATTVIAAIADLSDIYVQANVEETDIVKIREGQPVSVVIDAYPGRTFTGRVTEIDKMTQSALSGNALSFSTSGTYTKVTQLIPVKISLDDLDSGAQSGIIGTNATVKIKIK
ncbi:hypothetical protein FACS189492_1720 [Clostridia bacterium]|nr:hypothetical protein FACS189492_1720 [Clostridia bacterium]